MPVILASAAMSEIYTYVHAAAHLIESKFSSKRDESKLRAQRLLDHDPKDFVDICIHFIGASGKSHMDTGRPILCSGMSSGGLVAIATQPYAHFTGLPKMDVVGSSDPFFVAKLDDDIKFMCVFALIELAQYLMIPLPL